MGDVSLDMIWKRLEEMQAGQEAIRVELVAVDGKMGGMGRWCTWRIEGEMTPAWVA
jgi:hypothetical protein